jgi:hypothetical protein
VKIAGAPYKNKERTQVNTANIGCIGELMVTVDLMRRGFEVFRAVSAGCSCDLIAIKENKSQRIEVTKGSRLTKDKHLMHRAHNSSHYDIIAIWEDDGILTYVPPIDHPV